MKTAEERAELWLAHRKKVKPEFKYDSGDIASLEFLLVAQDRITRHACEEACQTILAHQSFRDECHRACMNVKAV